MLAHLLNQRGKGASLVSRAEIAGRNLANLDRQGIEIACLSYVNPGASQHAQRTIRRLRQHFGPDVRVMLGMWAPEPSPEAPQALLQTTGADLVATSLRQAVRQVEEESGGQPETQAASATTAA